MFWIFGYLAFPWLFFAARIHKEGAKYYALLTFLPMAADAAIWFFNPATSGFFGGVLGVWALAFWLAVCFASKIKSFALLFGFALLIHTLFCLSFLYFFVVLLIFGWIYIPVVYFVLLFFELRLKKIRARRERDEKSPEKSSP
ncbi:MAG: hypothetical protein ACI4P6_06225 [Candidatus Spyradosoma sp.]